MSLTSTSQGRGQNKCYWTDEEDEKLVQSLLELHHDKQWKDDPGFKSGYLKQLQYMMELKPPGREILANPHIESRIKTLKTKYHALVEMLNQSGFNWNEQEMMLVCEKSVYIEWVEKRNKDAAGLYDDEEEEIRGDNTNVDGVNPDDDILFDNVNPVGDMGSQHGGVENGDAAFTQPSPQTPSAPQSVPTQSISFASSRQKGKALDEMSKNFALMAKAVAGMAPKFDQLVNVLSGERFS